MSHAMEHHSTVKLPDGCEGGGCFGQSSGLLQCAFPEKGGRTIAVFGLDAACKWSMKHRFSMQDAFGRDEFVGGAGSCGYQIIAIDLEREGSLAPG
ncbi:F-box protein [Hordeum vulgare]|nr:F-box protein [Hordeum vulgare]